MRNTTNNQSKRISVEHILLFACELGRKKRNIGKCSVRLRRNDYKAGDGRGGRGSKKKNLAVVVVVCMDGGKAGRKLP